MTINTKQLLEEIKIKKAEVQKLVQERGEEALIQAAKEIFEKFPFLGQFSWTQYTPYFNDGDPCEFRVGEDYNPEGIVVYKDQFATMNIGEDDYYHDEDDEDDLEEENLVSVNLTYAFKKANPEHPLVLAEKAFGEFIEMDEDLFESVWGNHVRVVATREGFKSDEYSHD